MHVYKIINSVNNRIYVGITSQTLKVRFDWHIRDCKKGVRKKLYSAMRKIGIENFSIVHIEEYFDESLSADKEEFYIELYDSYDNGYNASRKSSGIHQHTFETKIKMSAAAKGRKLSTRTKLRKSRAMKKYWKNLDPDKK